jgi:hypothetical protein
MRAELAAARDDRSTRPTGRRLAFGVPRFALAGLALAAVLVALSFVVIAPSSEDRSVEAATIEGVVVGSDEGSLTVQTLDSLEEVTVPGDAQLSDETGARLDLASIGVGQVVVVRGSRPPGGVVSAANVQRVLNGLPGWCTDDPARCRQIGRNLEQARDRCRANPGTCRLLQERIDGLIAEITDIAALEELKQRCREDGEPRCREFIAFCRQHPAVCIAPDPPGPVLDRIDEARDRLQALQRLCAERDTRACRQIAQICGSHPALCPEGAPTAPSENRVAPVPTVRPAKTVTPASTDVPARPQPTATSVSEKRPVPTQTSDQRPAR